jgi:hypothetical protein
MKLCVSTLFRVKPRFLHNIPPTLRCSAGCGLADSQEIPEFKYWLRLYKDHRILESYIKKTFLKFGELAGIGIGLFDLFKLNRKQRLILGSEKFNHCCPK